MNGFYGFAAPYPVSRPTLFTARRPPYVSGRSSEERWCCSAVVCTAPTASSPTVNSLRVSPITFPRHAVVDQLAFNVTSAGGAGSLSMVGMYDTEGDGWYPTRLLFNGTSWDTNANTGVLKDICCIPVVANRLYWMAFNCGTAAPQCRCCANASSWPIGSWEDQGGSTPGTFITVSSTYSANGLPSIFPRGGTFPSSSGPFMPLIGVRLSA